MKEKLEALKQKALADLEKVSDTQGLEQMRVAYLRQKKRACRHLKGHGTAFRRRTPDHRPARQQHSFLHRAGF